MEAEIKSKKRYICKTCSNYPKQSTSWCYRFFGKTRWPNSKDNREECVNPSKRLSLKVFHMFVHIINVAVSDILLTRVSLYSVFLICSKISMKRRQTNVAQLVDHHTILFFKKNGFQTGPLYG
ncbi:hypothetical protein PGB90_002025 [Kerria lacca]